MEGAKGDLDQLPRDELIARARQLGIERPEVMTRVELKDEIIRRVTTDEASRRRARGWLGVARDLVASLIEQGLNMPDAAKLVRSAATPTRIRHQPPVATVTLAEIYATQGHLNRALAMLDEVLAKEPDHAAARALSDRLRGHPVQPEPEREPEPDPEPEPQPEPEPEAEAPSEAQPEPEPEPEPELEAPAPPEPERVRGLSDRPEPMTPRVVIARDAIVTITTEDGGAWVYWELAARSLAKARARWPQGYAVVQLVALVPRWEGARRYEREIPAEPSAGSARIPPYEGRAVVRAALGWREGARFHPIAVATELAPPNGQGDGARVRWAPSSKTSVDLATQERALARFVATRAS